MPDRKQKAEWLRAAIEGQGTRPFVLLNVQHAVHDPRAIREQIAGQLPHGLEDLAFLVTSITAIDDIQLPMKPEHRDFFMSEEVGAGWAFYVPAMIAARPPRSQGRQEVDGLEAQARLALHVWVAVVTERLRACADIKSGSRIGRDAGRLLALEKIAPEIDVGRFAGHADREARSLKFAQNALREGQARLKTFFPQDEPRFLLREAYDSVTLEIANGEMRLAKLAALVEENLRIVRTFAVIHYQAQLMSRAEHEVSGRIRSGHSTLSRAQHQLLAHARQGGPSLADLMAAAATGDLNPALLFRSVASHATTFAIAQRLGGLDHGKKVFFEEMHLVHLERAFLRAVEKADNAARNVDAERQLCGFALKCRNFEFWRVLFATRKAGYLDDGVWLSP